MKRDMVNRYLQHFKDVGVEVHLVQMAPLALCNFVAYDLLGHDGSAAAGAARPVPEALRRRPWTSAPTAATSSSPTANASSGSGPSRWAATTSPAP